MLGVLPEAATAQSVSAQAAVMPSVAAVAAPAIMPTQSVSTRTVVAAPPVSSSNQTVTLDYSPTITVQGGADAGTVSLIREALAEQARQFKKALPRMLSDIRARERRLSYE